MIRQLTVRPTNLNYLSIWYHGLLRIYIYTLVYFDVHVCREREIFWYLMWNQRYWYIFEPYKSSFFLTVNLELPNDVACQYASGWLWTIQLNWHQYNKIVFWYSTGLLNRIKRRSTTSRDMLVGINVKSSLFQSFVREPIIRTTQ